MEIKKNSQCKRERERERLVRGMRGAIWVSKFNSAHEKATESERREQERERAKTRVRGKYAEAQKAPAICCRRGGPARTAVS